MPHEHDSTVKTQDAVNVAAVWPATARMAPAPIPDIVQAAPVAARTPMAPAPRLTGILRVVLAAAYLALIAALAAAAVATRELALIVVIAALLLAAFFTLRDLSEYRRAARKMAEP